MDTEHLKNICKFGSKGVCKYLGCGSDGFTCLKYSSFRTTIDAQSESGEMVATGDNCNGIYDEKEGPSDTSWVVPGGDKNN